MERWMDAIETWPRAKGELRGSRGHQNPEYLGKYPTIHPTIPYVGIWMDGWMDAIGTWQRAKGELRGSWGDQDTECLGKPPVTRCCEGQLHTMDD